MPLFGNSAERRMFQSTFLPSQSSQILETGESTDSGGPFQHLEFIAEEVHVDESSQLRRETRKFA